MPASAPQVPPTAHAQSTSHDRVHRFSDNWGNGPGCLPKGDELSLRGTLVVRPFGKGTDGALLKTDTDAWIVNYRAEGILLELRDKQVVVHGRACDMQGEAVAGKHFDLRTLVEVPR